MSFQLLPLSFGRPRLEEFIKGESGKRKCKTATLLLPVSLHRRGQSHKSWHHQTRQDASQLSSFMNRLGICDGCGALAICLQFLRFGPFSILCHRK